MAAKTQQLAARQRFNDMSHQPGPSFRLASEKLAESALTDEEVELRDELLDRLVAKELIGPKNHRKLEKIIGKSLAKQKRLIDRFQERALTQPGYNFKVLCGPGRLQAAEFIPGHLWGSHDVSGPKPSDVMVVGKWPGNDESGLLRNLAGPSGKCLQETCRRFRVPGMAGWYVTNLCKFAPPIPKDRMMSSWLNDNLPLFSIELKRVCPKYILCLGADAAKAVLGKNASIKQLDGRVIELDYEDEAGEAKQALVMCIIHPAQVLREAKAARRQFERGIARWGLLLSGIRFDKEETGLNYHIVDNLEDLNKVIEEAERDACGLISVDLEWEGAHPQNEGSYVRSIQFSWKPKSACCVVLRMEGGASAFHDGIPAALDRIRKYLRGKRLVGHYFVNDMKWLLSLGIDLRKEYRVPSEPKNGLLPWERTRTEGSIDTSSMFHAIEETGPFGLEILTQRYTTMPRYDIPLEVWKKEYCSEKKIKISELTGYGMVPGEILYPYGCCDADAGLRIALEGDRLLDEDYEGNCCREAFWRAMQAIPATLEMEDTGILVNEVRLNNLGKAFKRASGKLLEELRDWAKWPEFNIRSHFHVREFLFGEEINGKPFVDNKPVRIRPKGAKSLRLQPVMDTSKRPVLWEELVEKGEESEHSPGTNKLNLAILSQDNEAQFQQVDMVRNLRFLNQMVRGPLRLPIMKDGVRMYEKGLGHYLCSDGRVRTHFQATKDTGRWGSSSPPLQNYSKKRDKEYKALLGDAYKKKIRSIFRASPGCLLIEADYIGAELMGMAIMSGDQLMIEHCTRSQLDEDHPNYYDIHSNIAVMAYKLKCAPTKKALKDAGHGTKRDLAKAVIFGLAYGRGARAIALAAREEKVLITVEEAQAVIDAVLGTYRGLEPFFAECRYRVSAPGWLVNCFGRYRRFPQTDDRSLLGDFERQAMNFPIQSMVADAVSGALHYLYNYRSQVEIPDMYRMLLQVHDAILLEVPYEHVDFVAKSVFPYCMSQCVPIYPSKLDGTPVNRGPYRLGVEVTVYRDWGERLSKEECRKYGVSEEFGLAT